jgi:hypothetical protein
MSLWFKPDVFKLKKVISAIIMECPFCFELLPMLKGEPVPAEKMSSEFLS